MTTKAPSYTEFLAPRYWLTWLGIGLLCLAALTPFRIRMALGAGLGWLTWGLARKRRYITDINIGICFPELDAAAKQDLVKASFIENGIGLVETACGWIRAPQRFLSLAEMRGGDALQAALDLGKGVLLFGGHYSTLDFSANLLSLFFPFAVTYRAHKNPLFDAFMLRGRMQNCTDVFDRRDIRGAFRHLKQGKLLWYAPDQDYGPDQAVYAHFFSRQAATITAGSRFASFNHSPVFIVRHHRDTKAGKYVIETIPLPGFPGKDEVQDATLVNAWLEASIRINPAQYLWMHKRFKTNPGGKPESPYIDISTPNRKLNQARHAQLTSDAVPVEGFRNRVQLQSSLELRTWPGQARRLWNPRHPALQLDSLSKHLRSHQIPCITVDSVFRFPFNNTSAATCFIPAGKRVSDLPAAHVPPVCAAIFLSRLHKSGCSFRTLLAHDLLYTQEQLALDDPLQLRRYPGTAAYQYCVQDLISLASLLGYQPGHQQAFYTAYLETRRPGDQIQLSRLLAVPLASADNVAHPDSESLLS